MNVAHLSLRPDPHDVRIARDFCMAEIAVMLAAVPGSVVDPDRTASLDAILDDAAMITSELVTNAVRAGSTVIELTIERQGSTMRIDIADDAAGEVALDSPDPLAPGGRGLRIVADLAESWGVTDHPAGKSVWAALDLSALCPTSTGSDPDVATATG